MTQKSATKLRSSDQRVPKWRFISRRDRELTLARFRPCSRYPIGSRCDRSCSAERGREVTLVGEADLERHLGERQLGLAEQPLSALHSELEDIFTGSQPRGALELAMKMKGA